MASPSGRMICCPRPRRNRLPPPHHQGQKSIIHHPLGLRASSQLSSYTRKLGRQGLMVVSQLTCHRARQRRPSRPGSRWWRRPTPCPEACRHHEEEASKLGAGRGGRTRAQKEIVHPSLQVNQSRLIARTRTLLLHCSKAAYDSRGWSGWWCLPTWALHPRSCRPTRPWHSTACAGCRGTRGLPPPNHPTTHATTDGSAGPGTGGHTRIWLPCCGRHPRTGVALTTMTSTRRAVPPPPLPPPLLLTDVDLVELGDQVVVAHPCRAVARLRPHPLDRRVRADLRQHLQYHPATQSGHSTWPPTN